jgi:hypothetical protein
MLIRKYQMVRSLPHYHSSTHNLRDQAIFLNPNLRVLPVLFDNRLKGKEDIAGLHSARAGAPASQTRNTRKQGIERADDNWLCPFQ